MRWLTCLALVVGGCTMEVGEGQLPPLTVEGHMNLPSAAARAGVSDATWANGDGEQMHVHAGGGGTFLSVSKEMEFFTKDQSTEFKQQLRGKPGAVQRIDVIVKSCTLGRLEGLDAEAVLDGTTLGPDGMTARVALSGETRDRVVAAVDAEEPVVLGVGVQVSSDPDRIHEVPNGVDLLLVVQPILVIDELKAL